MADLEADLDKQTLPQLISWIRKPNIAEDIDGEVLGKLATQVIEDFNDDKGSMDDWEKFIEAGRRLAKQELGGKSEPWEKSANFKSPVLLQASIKFGDRANLALLKKKDLVKFDVVGNDEDGTKADQGKNVVTHMNYQLNYEMEEWRGDQDAMLYQVSSEGCEFKHTFFDATLGRNMSEVIKYPDFAINQKATNILTTPFSILRDFKQNTVLEKQRAGIWSDDVTIVIDRDTNKTKGDEKDNVSDERFIEQQCFYDLDGDGYEEPYLVVVHQNTRKVLRIVARYEEDNIFVKDSDDSVMSLRKVMDFRQGERKASIAEQRDKGLEIDEADITTDGLDLVRIDPINAITKYGFIPDFIDGNYLNLGYLHLLASMTQAINSSSNHLLNAGFLRNLQGGWLARGFRKLMGPIKFKPGHWEETDIPVDKLQAGMLPHQYQEPSQVLLAMNQGMTAEAKEVIAITDLVSAVGANAPATTMLGLIQEQLMPVTALIMRIYRAEKEEFIKLYNLNAKFTDPEDYQIILDDPEADFTVDYDVRKLDIMPAANPEMTSKIQNLIQSQVLLDESERILQLGGNPIPVMKDFLDNLGVDSQQIFPEETEDEQKARVEKLRADQALQTKVIEKQLELGEREIITLEQRELIRLELAKVEIGEIMSKMLLNLEKAETEDTKNAISIYTQGLQTLDDKIVKQIETIKNEQTRQLPAPAAGQETIQPGQ